MRIARLIGGVALLLLGAVVWIGFVGAGSSLGPLLAGVGLGVLGTALLELLGDLFAESSAGSGAEASGGVATLRALAGPLPDVTFCPTGGVTEAGLGGYLRMSNVACVGGSWLVSPEDRAAGDPKPVMERARRALAIAREVGWSPRATV